MLTNQEEQEYVNGFKAGRASLEARRIVRVFERPDGSRVMVRFWSDKEALQRLTDTATRYRQQLDAAMDRIDTLTAENADAPEIEPREQTQAESDLRSLRAAVAEAKRKWERDTADSAIRYLLKLTALVPSDGSWET